MEMACGFSHSSRQWLWYFSYTLGLHICLLHILHKFYYNFESNVGHMNSVYMPNTDYLGSLYKSHCNKFNIFCHYLVVSCDLIYINILWKDNFLSAPHFVVHMPRESIVYKYCNICQHWIYFFLLCDCQQEKSTIMPYLHHVNRYIHDGQPFWG